MNNLNNISIIVAIDKNYAIGKDNKLLWHISNDLKRFKQLTLGKTVIMGRNTYFSLPSGALPNRKNIVVTDKNEIIENCTIANSIEDAINKSDFVNENFIIGGAIIYKQFMPIASKLYITQVDSEFEADTFFPIISKDEWKISEESEIQYDEKANLKYKFINYVRK